jgi:hypothetical protein
LAKIILLYQIIELSAPSYPPYLNSTKPPHPLTECKLLRHLIAHAGDANSSELRTYCAYLNVPPVMLDRTDSAYVELLSSKCKLVEAQAKGVLESALILPSSGRLPAGFACQQPPLMSNVMNRKG